jgi:hypothetical protein
MVRVSNNLRNAAQTLLLCAAIAGCGGSDEPDAPTGVLRPGLIQFSPMYSAFGGAQTYSLTPYVPSADPASKDSDPVMVSTIKWTVDGAFAKQDPFADLPGGIKLTTKKTGKTTVSLTATTAAGTKVRAESALTIGAASDDDWAKGDMRYSGGMTIDFAAMFRNGAMMMPTASGMGVCGLPFNIMASIPKEASCTNCHNTGANAIAVEHTPTQTAGYSDEQLISIFTQGQKPAGYAFNSVFLKMLPQPDCVYAMFHTWQIDEDTKRGIVLKLRSIEPKKQEAVDFAKLIQMARMNMGAPAATPAP